MKKNLIIAGVPRAGKTTVSHLLAQRYDYQHLCFDAINAGFERCFPQLGINTYAELSSMEILYNISGKIAPFINAMFASEEYEKCERGLVIDVYQLLPEDYVKHIDPMFCDIFYFVTGDVTPEERYMIQRKYDTPQDYTYHKSDDEIREGCVYLVEQSRLMREQCEKYGLPCYETARDRERVINNFIEMIGHT